jgi:hypothetical protein
LATSVSSSPARAIARSTPSPIAATSRRIACPTVTIESAAAPFGLGEADRDLRHRLRDHPHFLAAPGEAREEVEQQHRRKEQRGKAGEHQHAAALSDRRLQRGQEADGQQAATDHPDAPNTEASV